MCDMRDAGTLNFKTSLQHHPLSQEKITDRFMARKMLSAGPRADARNNFVEIIRTNCRGHWHVVPNWLRHSRTNRLHGSHPQIHQMERVSTVATTELRINFRTIHITQSWIGWISQVRINTYTMITLEALYIFFVQTARFVANLVAHVGKTELVRWGRRLTLEVQMTCTTGTCKFHSGTEPLEPRCQSYKRQFHILLLYFRQQSPAATTTTKVTSLTHEEIRTESNNQLKLKTTLQTFHSARVLFYSGMSSCISTALCGR